MIKRMIDPTYDYDLSSGSPNVPPVIEVEETSELWLRHLDKVRCSDKNLRLLKYYLNEAEELELMVEGLEKLEREVREGIPHEPTMLAKGQSNVIAQRRRVVKLEAQMKKAGTLT